MDLAELTGFDENHPAYARVAAFNGHRLHGFLQSMVDVALEFPSPTLSHTLVKALNFHAIAGLYATAGQYRSHVIRVGDYIPPEPFRVQSLMDIFLNDANRGWESVDAIPLAAWALWRINHIHPFINGNGRTARAVCYFVLCIKARGWLPGHRILPDRLVDHREEYVDALRQADIGDLAPLQLLLSRLLEDQLAGR